MLNAIANVTVPWSKRAKNRISTVLTPFDYVVPNSICLRDLPSERDLARVYEIAPQVISALVKGPTTAHVFEQKNGDLCAIAAEHVMQTSKAPKTGMTLIMGLGGSEQLPSPRIAAILRPMLEAASEIKRIGLAPPAIRVFKANWLASAVNRLDPERVRTVSNATAAFLHDYSAAFYPGIEFSFHIDETPAMTRCFDQEIATAAAALQLPTQLLAIGGKRSSPMDKLRYAIAHAYQLQCVDEQEQLLAPSFDSTSIVIYGGIAERCFVSTIKECVAMESRLGKTAKPRAHVVHRIGRKPAYLPHEWEKRIGETITDRDTVTHNDIDTTSQDWLSFGDSTQTFLDFCNQWRLP